MNVATPPAAMCVIVLAPEEKAPWLSVRATVELSHGTRIPPAFSTETAKVSPLPAVAAPGWEVNSSLDAVRVTLNPIEVAMASEPSLAVIE